DSTAAGSRIGQELFDAFCRDLDHNLREMGVGDLAVPKRMRQFGEAFYGRQAAYVAALAAADAQELEKALQRNIFAGADHARGAARLAQYAHAARRQIAGQDDSALRRGQVSFPHPDSIAEAITHA
ncbi:MAG: ubiquinol-cytochrome C chaperone family protein, partial [Xanthobacteraceae bacterium]